MIAICFGRKSTLTIGSDEIAVGSRRPNEMTILVAGMVVFSPSASIKQPQGHIRFAIVSLAKRRRPRPEPYEGSVKAVWLSTPVLSQIKH
jgi:hypothetical protein